MNITITGDIGSGKSTVARQLAKELNMNVVEAGELYREYSMSKGLDVLQQNHSEDWSIDKEIDSKIEVMGKQVDNTIFVSRMAWHFVPNAIKIYLAVNPMLAATRVMEDSSRTSEKHTTCFDTYLYNKERKETELKRYKALYDVEDASGKSDSDIVIIIGKNTIYSVCECIKYAIQQGKKGIFIDPKVLLPTQSIRDFNMNAYNEYCSKLPSFQTAVDLDIEVANDGDLYYIVDGHHRVAATVYNHNVFIHIQTIESKSYTVEKRNIYDWADLLRIDLSSEIKCLALINKSLLQQEAVHRGLSYEQLLDEIYRATPTVYKTDNKEQSVLYYYDEYLKIREEI